MSHIGLTGLLHQFGYGFVFLLLLAEAAGLPLPGETVMIAAALYAAHAHRLDVVPLVLAAFAGTVAGGAIGYALGRRFGTALLARFGPRLGMGERRQLLGRYLMLRRGMALVVFGRFVAVLRSIFGLLAGASRMGWGRFMLGNIIGAALWTGLYCLGAYWLGHAVMALAGTAGIAIGVIALAALTAAFMFVRSHEARLTQLALQAKAAGELP